MGGFPPKVRSHCAAHLQIFEIFLLSASLRSATDYEKEPKFYLCEYEPRKNSGIRGLSLRTEGAFGNAVFEGLHTPHSALRLFHNRRIDILLSKKFLNNLHMCKICCTFVADLEFDEKRNHT